MYTIQTFNKISKAGLDRFGENYTVTDRRRKPRCNSGAQRCAS